MSAISQFASCVTVGLWSDDDCRMSLFSAWTRGIGLACARSRPTTLPTPPCIRALHQQSASRILSKLPAKPSCTLGSHSLGGSLRRPSLWTQGRQFTLGAKASRPRAFDPRFFSSNAAAPAELPVLSPPPVAGWLIFSSVLVFAVIVVGGVTRLTESGLSITEWKPIAGVIPPLSRAEWEEEFTKYKATPEFKL